MNLLKSLTIGDSFCLIDRSYGSPGRVNLRMACGSWIEMKGMMGGTWTLARDSSSHAINNTHAQYHTFMVSGLSTSSSHSLFDC
jgi:hypothetical protein